MGESRANVYRSAANKRYLRLLHACDEFAANGAPPPSFSRTRSSDLYASDANASSAHRALSAGAAARSEEGPTSYALQMLSPNASLIISGPPEAEPAEEGSS